MGDLADRHCEPCRAGTPPLGSDAIEALRRELDPAWTVVDGHHLTRTFRLPDFRSALALTNRLGELAEELDHHPDLHLSWGKVVVEIWTHKIGGLSENDFVWAARADRIGAAG